MLLVDYSRPATGRTRFLKEKLVSFAVLLFTCCICLWFSFVVYCLWLYLNWIYFCPSINATSIVATSIYSFLYFSSFFPLLFLVLMLLLEGAIIIIIILICMPHDGNTSCQALILQDKILESLTLNYVWLHKVHLKKKINK